jgi:hypothetical protein
VGGGDPNAVGIVVCGSSLGPSLLHDIVDELSAPVLVLPLWAESSLLHIITLGTLIRHCMD